MRITLPTQFAALACVFLNSCADRDPVTLPEIDTSTSASGIVALPDDVPQVFRDYFVKYTRVIAPNGKPIHILAQDGWTDDQIKHGRNVLQHLLTDFPGSLYGHDKNGFEGGDGNDELVGGGGEDTAIFTGPASEYNIVFNQDSVAVRDLQEDRDGTDLLRDIELLRFSDSSVQVRPQDVGDP